MHIKYKKCYSVIIATLLIFIFLTSFSYALYASHVYGIDKYKQESSLWCWNACSRMVADYRYNVTLSQTDMAKKIFWWWGADIYQTATWQQTASALKLYTNSTKNTGYITSSCSFNTIAGKLDSSNNPIIIGIYYSNTDEYHMLASYGYDSVPTKKMYYVDPKGPWTRCDDFSGTYGLYDGSGSQQSGIAYFLDGQW